MPILTDLRKGWQAAVSAMRPTELGDKYAKGKKETTADLNDVYRSHTVLPITQEARGFYKDLSRQGVTTKTPAQMTGAVAARLLTDLGEDGTRKMYWRYNHPMAIADKIAEQVVGGKIYEYSPTKRAAIQLASVGIPVSASLGTFDITNLGELGRPKGFAQSYAEEGSEDRRQTGQVLPELIDRFFLGRQGRPLKFETAQEDIPDLTKRRYANYMNYLYNDKGPLGIGIVKGTMENLQGEPELRVVGFPIGLQAAGALAGGAGATALALRGQKQLPRARYVAAAGAGGALAGAAMGKIANAMLATQGQSQLPTVQEYTQGM